jgi:hypothetical protein
MPVSGMMVRSGFVLVGSGFFLGVSTMLAVYYWFISRSGQYDDRLFRPLFYLTLLIGVMLFILGFGLFGFGIVW